VTLTFYPEHFQFNGDYGFSDAVMDIRYYRYLPWRDVISIQFYCAFTPGETPFQLLPELGGQNLMRGYYQGRYRDRVYTAAQSEYKFIFLRRWALVAFLGTGQVAGSLSDLDADGIKFAGGGGLRFYIVQSQRIAFRLDAGFSKNDRGVYFNLLEAF